MRHCSLACKALTFPTLCQVRRARAWFPCVDTPASAHPFDLRLTVADGLTAVAPGELQRVTLTLDRRKTFHYQLPLDTPPCHISIAVGALLSTSNCKDQSLLRSNALRRSLGASATLGRARRFYTLIMSLWALSLLPSPQICLAYVRLGESHLSQSSDLTRLSR